jgi:hypothetical protein
MTRERRWVAICEDGRHVTLGRHTDPSEDEIKATEAALLALGQGGWLAVTEGTYYSRDTMSVLQVRMLGKPAVTWDEVKAAFLSLRDAATDPAMRSR